MIVSNIKYQSHYEMITRVHAYMCIYVKQSAVRSPLRGFLYLWKLTIYILRRDLIFI